MGSNLVFNTDNGVIYLVEPLMGVFLIILNLIEIRSVHCGPESNHIVVSMYRNLLSINPLRPEWMANISSIFK